MKRREYLAIENHMRLHMGDSAHDQQHIYRVLYAALAIAGQEQGVDYDILLAACLLHDIGRQRQFEDPSLCHAAEGAKMACAFLSGLKWPALRVQATGHCIAAHRYRGGVSPQSLEAKILFDADKLDACGLLGIARTLIYQGQVNQPLYQLLEDGAIDDGKGSTAPSFFREYNYKLKNLYNRFYTQGASALATQRQKTADAFYSTLLEEACSLYDPGRAAVDNLLNE